MPDAVIHPTPQELTAFGLGKLPEHAAAAVATHLEFCPACRQVVAGVIPDSFLDKVRAAKQAGSSFPPSLARQGNAPSNAKPPAIPTVPCPNIPPELARHPKYLILRELGRGGMGVVYQARQTMMDRQVVIKVINRSLLQQPGALDRFRREIRAAAQLSHPNIVTAYDAEQAGELHMLIMEFVPGQSLAEVLERKGPLPVVNACHYMCQVALGLKHAHERGMVHRDIKPSNLILMPGPKGQVKILDFGLAKIISESGMRTGITASGDYMGTPDYCAPEQALDAAKADIRADLYGLGCTLYCLLAGRPPYQEDTAIKTVMAHMQKEPKPLPELRKDVPVELWQVVKRLLAKEPGQRYQNPVEVFRALSVFVKPGAKPPAKVDSAPVQGVGSPVKGTKVAADTGQIKKILQEVPGKSPPKKEQTKKETSPFENLVDTSTPLSKAKGRRESAKRLTKALYRSWPALVGAGVVLLVLLGVWARGVFKQSAEQPAPPSTKEAKGPVTQTDKKQDEPALPEGPKDKKAKEETKKAAPPADDKKDEPATPKVRKDKVEEPNKNRKEEPIAPQAPGNQRVTLTDNASVDDLRRALKDKDPDMREQAAARLAKLGPKAEPAMHDLADTLTDAKNPPKVRSFAALAIGKIGDKAKPVVPALAKSLERSQPLEIRRNVAEALAFINYPANKEAIPDMLDVIANDTITDVRIACVWALNEMAKPELKESGADKMLTKVLDESGNITALVRYNAARKLAHAMHEEAPDKTVDVLLEMLTNPTVKVYIGTDVKPEKGRPEMQANIGGDARFMAAQALGWLGKKASGRKDVVDALKAAAKDADPKLRESATAALKELGVH
jgi:serine/threonine protein kinase/HEAT repeat protein